MQTKWGRSQVGYLQAEDYAPRLQALPPDLRQRVEDALNKFAPAAERLRKYHEASR
jgi:hypothetical protein